MPPKTQGLTSRDTRTLHALLRKSNAEQLAPIITSTEKEIERRFEVQIRR